MKVQEVRKDILTVLDDHEQLSVLAIAEIMGVHPVTIDRHCYQLYQDGYIRVFNGGIYRLTDEGADYLIQYRSASHS